MSSLLIVQPLIPTTIPAAYTRLFTPDPKEAVTLAATTTTSIDVDFGSVVQLDTFYAGYHNAAVGGQTITIATLDSSGNATNTSIVQSPMTPLGLGFPYHWIGRLATPLSSQRWRFSFVNFSSTAFYAGIVAMGLAFQPQFGQEYGSGRYVVDTGTADRLFGGGFGINEGVRAAGWQWTMGDLSDAELRKLFQIAKDRGQSRTVLVVEDPDQTDGLNERVHWSLFQKLQPYERLSPGLTKWAMTVEEWA